ncbi:O-antigen polymerase [Sagittula salina]|uniref:Oligosaccharide repeat unit polymerase n=1 Tax=Sagittula salina TaxID=2820268 RepID=A0A940MTN9_9RHOB|nr:O-antigen polymerase [Sagittula salina]MBP0484463.1 oligosaccharide repeat unit polymerase [Sagittula salina]
MSEATASRTPRSGPVEALRALRAENPFITISPAARLAIVIYFVGWRILPLCAQLTAEHDVATAHQLLTIACKILTQGLLLAPMVSTRFFGARMGWLHPLVLPALVSVLLTTLQSPETLLAPLLGWFAGFREITHELYTGMPQEVLYRAQFRGAALTVLSVICLYGGFAASRLPIRLRQDRRREIRLHGGLYAAFFGLCFVVVVYFLDQQGGILRHMASFASGRFAFREFAGPFLVVNDFLPVMLILWYLYRPQALRNPVFLGVFLLSCVFQFIVTGSRSGMFVPIATLLAAWMMVTRKVPAVRAILLGVTALLLVGVLGEIRRSGSDGQVDFSSLVNFDLVEARDKAEEELEGRDRDASMAVFVAVPQQVGHLWGKTYVAALGFWVPRAIWKDKPRGAGPHTAALIYRGLDTMEGYTGGGIPPGGVAEAYWNFNIMGVMLVYLLYGGFVRVLSDWYAERSRHPVRQLLLLVLMFQFTSPATFQIVNMLQTSVLIFVLLGITRLRNPVPMPAARRNLAT